MLDRRFFVLSNAGESGPFTVADLKHELQVGSIQRSDQLRTAMGKVVGTVGEQVGVVPSRPLKTISGPMRAVDSDVQALGVNTRRVQVVTHQRATPAEATRGSNPSNLTVPALVAGAVVLILGLAWIFTNRAGTSGTAAGTQSAGGQAIGTKPVVSVLPNVGLPTVRIDTVVALAVLEKPGLLRITTNWASTTSIMVNVRSSGLSVQTVVVPAGSTSVDIPVRVPKPTTGSGELAVPASATVFLLPGKDYVLSSSIQAQVQFRNERIASIAYEDFYGHSQGWGGEWGGQAFTPAPGFGVTVSGEPVYRSFKERLEHGDIWLSWYLRSNENMQHVAGLSLFDQGQEQLFIGRAGTRGGLSLEFAPDITRFINLPDHQFTTKEQIVVHLVLTIKETVVSWWVSPSAAGLAPPPQATLTLPPMGIDSLRLFALQPWAIGELRVGRSWDEAVPLP